MSTPAVVPTVVLADDLDRFIATDDLTWAGAPIASAPQRVRAMFRDDQRFAVDLSGGPSQSYSGVYAVLDADLGVPGGRLAPVSALSWVSVHPDVRRRGVLRAMMRDHLSRTYEAGLAHSVLHASEAGIYSRFGYGVAALTHRVQISAGTEFDAPGLTEADRLVTRMDSFHAPGVTERVHAVLRAAAVRDHGTLVPNPDFVDSMGLHFPEEQRDDEARKVLFASDESGDLGCVWFIRTQSWSDSQPTGTVSSGPIIGTPAARLALARRLVGFDLMPTVRLNDIGTDDPLLEWIGGPRNASLVQPRDSLWVRLVDVGAAWAARAYAADVDVRVEVRDEAAPWNAGVWRLRASGGEGHAVRTDEPAEVSLDVNVLGAGHQGRPLAHLLAAGRVTEHRTGAWSELARAMRTEMAPAPALMF